LFSSTIPRTKAGHPLFTSPQCGHGLLLVFILFPAFLIRDIEYLPVLEFFLFAPVPILDRAEIAAHPAVDFALFPALAHGFTPCLIVCHVNLFIIREKKGFFFLT